MSFTVIGDTVNTAARLQTLTRTLETPLVVGDPLVAAVKDGLPTSPPKSWNNWRIRASIACAVGPAPYAFGRAR